jgi:excisionase family DNA binding protein
VKDYEQVERAAGPEPGVEGARTLAIEASVGARVYRQLFDRESLAEYLRLSTDTVDRLVKAGKLPCVRIGHQVRFTLEDVEGFIERHRWLGPATR